MDGLGKGLSAPLFITAVFPRRIVEWALPNSVCTGALPLPALNQAIVCVAENTVAIHHSDHGSRVTSALSTTSVLPSMVSLLQPGLLVPLMTMPWQET